MQYIPLRQPKIVPLLQTLDIVDDYLFLIKLFAIRRLNLLQYSYTKIILCCILTLYRIIGNKNEEKNEESDK